MFKSNILAHRGLWANNEKNSILALTKASELGFGIETDIRDFNGEIVISHDIPNKKNILYLKEFLNIYKKNNFSTTLAINIKSDGLGVHLLNLMKKYLVTNWFAFDLSIPELIIYDKLNINFFSRLSEIEKNPISIKNAKGIWIDSFEYDWYSKNDIIKFINLGKKVTIVSSELHSRNHIDCWQRLKKFNLPFDSNSLMLCTDYPVEANKFFFEKYH